MTDKPHAIWRVVGGALVPENQTARNAMDGQHPGALVRATVHKRRSGPQHRLYWKLCSVIAENSERFSTSEHVSDLLKLSAGHCDLFEDAQGNVWETPRSIAFDKMPQPDFNAFMNQVVHIVLTRILPGIDAEALRAEIEAMVTPQNERKAA